VNILRLEMNAKWTMPIKCPMFVVVFVRYISVHDTEYP